MQYKTLIATTSAAFILGLSCQVQASTKTIVLSSDGLQLQASSLPGYAQAQANYVACHSAEYMAYPTTFLGCDGQTHEDGIQGTHR